MGKTSDRTKFTTLYEVDEGHALARRAGARVPAPLLILMSPSCAPDALRLLDDADAASPILKQLRAGDWVNMKPG